MPTVFVPRGRHRRTGPPRNVLTVPIGEDNDRIDDIIDNPNLQQRSMHTSLWTTPESSGHRSPTSLQLWYYTELSVQFVV